MYDAKKIVPGLIIFLGFATFPIWCAMSTGEAKQPPKVVYPKNAKKCVEETAWMRANHMDLLDTWRDKAIREGLPVSRSVTSTRRPSATAVTPTPT